MCGICGYRSAYPVPLEKMSFVLAHRGPDDAGVYRSRDVALAHRRLSIIDLKDGHQPMLSADGQIVLIFNGEIYNFLELKKVLQAQGHVFKTSSDTEVLLCMYEHYGTDCLAHLNGEFAFVLYDRRKDILFGARDRLGIKPLYYTQNDKGFFFASEIKALFESTHVHRRVNPVAVDLYLTFRYVPGRDTIYKDIYKILPGHAFVQSGNNVPRFWQYWDLPDHEEAMTFDEAYQRFDELLTDSVRYRLISDVPLGVYLSGGIDSTSLVAVMSSLKHTPIRSYTVGFDMALDESAQAQETAKRFSAEHLAVTVTPESMDLLPEIIWHMDEPFGDAILVPSFCLSREAARHVKAVLTGEGADEGQLGYVHHEALEKGFSLTRKVSSRLLQALGLVLPKVPVAFLDQFFNYPLSMGMAGRERLAQLVSLLPHPGQAYQHFCSLFTEEERARLYGPDLKHCLKEAKAAYHDPLVSRLDAAKDPLRDIYIHDIKHWLPDNILNKQDRMTMAHSLEGRVPYLDHRLIEFETKLPRALKLKNSRGKYLLRCYYERKIAIRNQVGKKKKAFIMPMQGVYHAKYLTLVDRYLNDAIIDTGLWNKQEIRSIIQNADRSPLLGHKKVIALVMLQIWQDVFKPEWK